MVECNVTAVCGVAYEDYFLIDFFFLILPLSLSLFFHKQRLGHDKLLNKRGSVKFAESIAMKKLSEQPDKKENVVLDDANRVEPMSAVGGY